MYKPDGCPVPHGTPLGDVAHSSKGKWCTQYKGTLLEKYQTRVALKGALERHGFALDDGSCKSAGFTSEENFHVMYKKNVEITHWRTSREEQLALNS